MRPDRPSCRPIRLSRRCPTPSPILARLEQGPVRAEHSLLRRGCFGSGMTVRRWRSQSASLAQRSCLERMRRAFGPAASGHRCFCSRPRSYPPYRWNGRSSVYSRRYSSGRDWHRAFCPPRRASTTTTHKSRGKSHDGEDVFCRGQFGLQIHVHETITRFCSSLVRNR
jgi:hypothetical protein